MADEATRVIDIAEPDGKPDVDGDPAANNGAAKPNRKPEKLNGYPAADPVTVKVNKSGRRGNPNIGQWNKQRAAERRAAAAIEEAPVSKAIEKISVTELLYSVHMMLAALTSVPELELDKDEAKKLGDAAREVGKYYVPEIDPKWVAIANLGAVAGFVYGPRVVAYRARKEAARERKPAPGPALADVPKPQAEAPPAPVPEAKVNGAAAAARNPRQMAPSELWPEPAGDWPGLG